MVDKRPIARRTLSVQSPLASLSHSQKQTAQQHPDAAALLHKLSAPTSVLQSSARICNGGTDPQSPIVPSPPTLMTPQAAQVMQHHRKLDRSLSEPVQPQQLQTQPSGCRSPTSVAAGQALINQAAANNQGNSSRYKTELCRPFEENGTCKYGDKCQFAHGYHELRTLARHPKYKTELCRTFHTTGFCPYGPRCHFIHNSDENKKTMITHLNPRNGGQNQGHGGLATRSNSIGGDVVRGNNNGESGSIRHLTRPKALSIGSFSLGSTGDLSPPSSLSASPTSLNGFFGEDPFFRNASLNNQNHQRHTANQQQHRLNLAQPTTPNTAFSFSQDFAALVQTPKTPNPFGGPSAFRPHLPIFGGSSPSLLPRSNPSLYVGSPQTSSDFLADSVSRDPMFKFPDAPPSPADSLSSELDALSLGGSSPEPAAHQQQAHHRFQNSPQNDSGARLPIFSRLANSDSE